MSDLESSILKTFVEAGGAAVSGDKIAKGLGMSRVGVWQRLEKLRGEGFVFDAAPRKGYRLTGVPAGLHPALLDAHLRIRKVRAPVEFLAEADSTNSVAERRLAAGAETPFVIAAAKQTAGRGRLGRAWHSATPENLYLSFAFRPFLPPDRMQSFSLVMALRLCSALATRHGIDSLKLKWPNDLVCDGLKIAGVLTEARVDADRVRDLVFGLGLNVNADPARLPAAIRDTAGSLSHALGRRLDLHAEAAFVISTALEAYEEFEHAAEPPDPAREFAEHDALRGATISVGLRGEPVSGTAEGVDSRGALLLRLASGRVLALNAGEVTLGKIPKKK